jgi:hypothetical protein
MAHRIPADPGFHTWRIRGAGTAAAISSPGIGRDFAARIRISPHVSGKPLRSKESGHDLTPVPSNLPLGQEDRDVGWQPDMVEKGTGRFQDLLHRE